MKWVIPSPDAITLGEIDGELVHSYPYKRTQKFPSNLPVIPHTKISSNAAIHPHKRNSSASQYSQASTLDDKASCLTETLGALQWLRILLWEDKDVCILKLTNLYDRCIANLSNFITAISKQFQEQKEETLKSKANKFAFVQTDETIQSIHFHSHNSRLAVAQCDGVVSFYDVLSGAWDKRVLTHENHTIFGIAWCLVPDGTLAVASRYASILTLIQQPSHFSE